MALEGRRDGVALGDHAVTDSADVDRAPDQVDSARPAVVPTQPDDRVGLQQGEADQHQGQRHDDRDDQAEVELHGPAAA